MHLADPTILSIVFVATLIALGWSWRLNGE